MPDLNDSWLARRTIKKGTEAGTAGLSAQTQITNQLLAEQNLLLRILAGRLAPEVPQPVQINPFTGEAMQPPSQR